METTETWMEIIGADRYEVSSLGRIRSTRTYARRGVRVRIRKPNMPANGYPGLNIPFWENGILVNRLKMIHRLVAEYFVSGYKEGLQVNHKNGVKSDYRASNLEWVTQGENMRHYVEHIKPHKKRLTLLEKKTIILSRDAGMTLSQLAIAYGVTASSIMRITKSQYAEQIRMGAISGL